MAVRRFPHRHLIAAAKASVMNEGPRQERSLLVPQHQVSEEVLAIRTPQQLPGSPATKGAGENAR